MKIWGKYNFEWTALIRPQLDDAGAIQAFHPSADYKNPQGLALHAYGAGPFCKFHIPSDKTHAGVYVLTLNAKPNYIGECTNLANRYNSGYGAISPRTCYEGGQPAYCRVNHLIFNAAKAGQHIELWFLKTANRPAVVSELTKLLRPPWNQRNFTNA
ncbi:hypothetical protein BH10CHL1_BH10CHL1_01370 [soil metagenome]